MEFDNVTHFTNAALFRMWLEKHHTTRDELWVGYWKKSTGRPTVTWEQTVDEALCFGWIDGIRKRVDDASYTIRFTPRRRGSSWSERNIERFAELSAAGRVAPAGCAAYRKHIESGARPAPKKPPVPEQLSADCLNRLQANRAAWKDWDSRPPGYRKQAVRWVMSAKREATRERRLAALIEDSAAGRKVKPLR